MQTQKAVIDLTRQKREQFWTSGSDVSAQTKSSIATHFGVEVTVVGI